MQIPENISMFFCISIIELFFLLNQKMVLFSQSKALNLYMNNQKKIVYSDPCTKNLISCKLLKMLSNMFCFEFRPHVFP